MFNGKVRLIKVFVYLLKVKGFEIMEGYHGTSSHNLDSIISSQEISISEFKINSNFSMPRNQRLVNDLGLGFYLFISDDYFNFDGKHAAKEYARHYKTDSKVLKVGLPDEGLRILDLNNTETRKFFNAFREKFFLQMHYNYGVSIKDDGAKKRANLDGIFLELLIQYKYKNMIDGVICDSYTPYYNDFRHLSNIPNGRELCLRTTDLIDWDKCEEVS